MSQIRTEKRLFERKFNRQAGPDYDNVLDPAFIEQHISSLDVFGSELQAKTQVWLSLHDIGLAFFSHPKYTLQTFVVADGCE
jgi:hypothetical protein